MGFMGSIVANDDQCADNCCAMAALLVLATYKELLPFVGLRRLVMINLCCSALAVLYSIISCTRWARFSGQWLSF